MELRHLRYFVAVAEESHFGRAAERLHVTQSTLSTQIQGLEREVGGPLFVRTSRRVELTEAGTLLLAEARRTLAQADRALTVARQSVSGEIGAVRVAFAGVAVLHGLLGHDLHRFRRAHPHVDLTLTELPPVAQLEALRDGSIDLGYCPDLGLGDTGGLTLTRRAATPLSVVVRADDPLATVPAVTAADLIDRDLVLFATHDDVTVLPRIWPAPAVHRGRIHLISSTLGALALASAGAGVAIVPAVTDRISLPDLTYRPLPATIAGPDILIITRTADPSGPLKAFLQPLL